MELLHRADLRQVLEILGPGEVLSEKMRRLRTDDPRNFRHLCHVLLREMPATN
jgi:hypothetical protein